MTYYEWDIKYPPSSENKVLDVLSVTNHRKILNHIQSHFTFMGLGIYISLSTGLRIGEICALKWSDINVTDGILTVNRTIERIYIIEHCCPEKFYHKVGCSTESASGTLTGVVG